MEQPTANTSSKAEQNNNFKVVLREWTSTKLKSFLKNNWLLILVIGFFLWQKIPIWWNEHQSSGQKLGSFELTSLDQRTVLTDQISKPHVFIFWATWCGPCKIEMKRIQSAVNEGDINPAHVTAISFDEDDNTLQKAIAENKYTFQFLKDTTGRFAASLQVKGTPSVVHVDTAGSIVWMNTGLSILGVQKAKSLLSSQ
jgi:cytochrome c biogenesis protein CcmG/thiol:disulfide interchange protein DsbE